MEKNFIDAVVPLTRKEIKDLKVLLQFTAVYCRVRHTDVKSALMITEADLRKLPLQKKSCL